MIEQDNTVFICMRQVLDKNAYVYILSRYIKCVKITHISLIKQQTFANVYV